MNKLIFTISILVIVFTGCKKEEDNVPSSAYETKINFYNFSKTQSILKDWVVADDVITFDIFASNKTSSDVTVSIEVIDSETTMSVDMYTLSSTSLTIPKGEFKASGDITFHYDAVTAEPKTLTLAISDASGKPIGYNDTIALSTVKAPNPTLTTFNDATLIGVYDGWDSPVEMAPVNESDPANSSMTLYNLWWGGETLIIDFNLDNNTIHIAADQVLDAGWAQDGYTLPWLIGEVNGTYDPIEKTISFDYSIYDANHLLYGTEPCTIQDVTK